jgi:hypothetical protein
MTQRNSPSTFRSPIPKSPQARESCIDPNHLWDTTFLISVPTTRWKASGVHGGTELQSPRWPTKSVREIRPPNRFFRSSDQNDQNTKGKSCATFLEPIFQLEGTKVLIISGI